MYTDFAKCFGMNN